MSPSGTLLGLGMEQDSGGGKEEGFKEGKEGGQTQDFTMGIGNNRFCGPNGYYYPGHITCSFILPAVAGPQETTSYPGSHCQ